MSRRLEAAFVWQTPLLHHLHHTTTAIPRFIAKNTSVFIFWISRLYGKTSLPAKPSPLCRQCCSGVDPCRVALCCDLIAAPKTTRRKHQREKEALHARSIAFVSFIGKGISTKKPRQ
ncbi:uncharacterized protein EURHEDRAFT_226306 [Aspergillus ruber CBS 135680]|uniref:Uncharacterized protein n=1 Tax=Aspergillus ruber (strain CBS 135680) TaxID=1388766 RepID=A0A017S538_ASPRC|nr:uncharacterized protein EURHEDRAFT_226306 [Aspergillus ruber CBS 135680]EYE91754.1 hypothetical protein EURHEDRAFT_226306 [Aspergillus ruber CBS 135680]